LTAAFAAAVENEMRISVPSEEGLQAQKIRRAGASEQYGSDASLVEADPSQDEGPHDELTQLSRPHDERAQPDSIERYRGTAVRTRHSPRKAWATRQLMELAGELPAIERLEVNLLIETVAPGYLRRATQ